MSEEHAKITVEVGKDAKGFPVLVPKCDGKLIKNVMAVSLATDWNNTYQNNLTLTVAPFDVVEVNSVPDGFSNANESPNGVDRKDFTEDRDA